MCYFLVFHLANQQTLLKKKQYHPLLLYGKFAFLVGGHVFKNQTPEQNNVERSIFAKMN